MRRILTLAMLAALPLGAQAPPAFDVASVKRDPWPGNSFVGIRVRGGTLTADHTCLYGLVEFAYKLRDGQLSGGPSWARCEDLASSDLYQVMAQSSGAPPPPIDQFRLMLQGLLADRFQLRVRHILKELPTYNLVAAPHGSKLKESPEDAKSFLTQDARVNGGRSIRVTATHLSMARLAEEFEHFAGRPLFDQTALTGFYDFEIEFDTDISDRPGPEPIGQTFAVALEKQLGLKLEPASRPFDTLVIDHAGKPSEN